MNILVINCGSSSVKFQLIDSESEKRIAKGLCERIGIEGSRLIYTPAGGKKLTAEVKMADHREAIAVVLKALTDPQNGAVKDLSEIGAVGHRIVHGGENFSKATLITDEVKKAIADCSDLAPLHNPANLVGIEACEALMPSVPFTRPCRRNPICMRFPIAITGIIASEGTAFTGPVMSMSLPGQPSCWDVPWRS